MPDFFDYCRQLEAYLCQKNGGHLVRIVGPSFERVCSWAEQGVPLKVALRGIDRYCERYYAKTTRRRPARIEFCEADVLELFDDWRRAVGVSSTRDEGAERARKPTLASHIERVVARLIARRGEGSPPFERHVEELLRSLDALAAEARHARGEARASVIERLSALDRDVMKVAASEIDERTIETIRNEAESELAAFGGRIAPEARAVAMDAAVERLVRESLKLPVIAYR